MLVCPQCQSENPNDNKFCIVCGTSLTLKECHQCGEKVPFSVEHCDHCGAFTGTVWWAIISQTPSARVEAQSPLVTVVSVSDPPADVPPSSADAESLIDPSIAPPTPNLADLSATPVPEAEENTLVEEFPQPENQQEASSPESNSTKEELLGILPEFPYLDPHHRYQVLGSLAPEEISREEINLRVLDLMPYQQSPLSALGAPDIAQPYLNLQRAFSETLPAVHDAWETQESAVVLIEDRSGWSPLVELWQDDQVPLLQILHGLDDMAKLWVDLEPWRMRQSLLEISNLRIDEDQTLTLQKLYHEPQSTELTLKDLGQVWQSLFQQSQRTEFLFLTELIQEVIKGEIETIPQLRERLQALASEMQPNLDSVAANEQPVSDEEETPESFLPRQEPLFMNQNPENEPLSTAGAETPTMPDLEAVNRDRNESDDMPTVVLPKQLIRLDDAGATHTGRQRNHNEDFFAINSKIDKQESAKTRSLQARGLYILCDGMGGHASGEVASEMAVDTIKRYFATNWTDQLPNEESIRDAIRLANQALFETNQGNARSGSGRMGTTLVMVLIQDTKIAIAHVGDSRLYRISRKRGLEQLTTDHEVGQREIQRGVEPAMAYSRPDAYQLTQALGPRDENFVRPDIKFLDIDEDCLLLLASDGLTDNDLLETYWQSHLNSLLSSRANLEQGVTQLIELANQHNGHDNITAVLVRMKLRPNFEQQQRL